MFSKSITCYNKNKKWFFLSNNYLNLELNICRIHPSKNYLFIIINFKILWFKKKSFIFCIQTFKHSIVPWKHLAFELFVICQCTAKNLTWFWKTYSRINLVTTIYMFILHVFTNLENIIQNKTMLCYSKGQPKNLEIN